MAWVDLDANFIRSLFPLPSSKYMDKSRLKSGGQMIYNFDQDIISQ